MEISELTPGFAALIIPRTQEELFQPESRAEIVAALNRFGVVAIRPAAFSAAQLSEFGNLFGETASLPIKGRIENTFVITNLGEDGKLWAADDPLRRNVATNELWHSDNTYSKIRTLYSMLQSEIAPPVGGQTEFADMRAAYAALPDQLKSRIEHLRAGHSLLHSRKLAGFTEWSAEELAVWSDTVVRGLVQTHPLTGEKCLCLASHISGIIGLPEEECAALLAGLRGIATDARFVYRHDWVVGDLVIWDNIATMHRSTPFEDLKYPRLVRSIRVLDPSDCVASDCVAAGSVAA